MPTKKLNGSTATIDEVVELHELGNLAEKWDREGSDFLPSQFERYQELCRKYGVDASTLLFVYQQRQFPNRLASVADDDDRGERTGVIELSENSGS